jgi:alpha-tubulin suppressor-like RCC1 family protein
MFANVVNSRSTSPFVPSYSITRYVDDNDDHNDNHNNVSGWRDVVAVSAGFEHTVGLLEDGTMVATGYNGCGQCDVSGWKDVAAVSAGWCHTVSLLGDGTVVATGDNDYGQCEVSG